MKEHLKCKTIKLNFLILTSSHRFLFKPVSVQTRELDTKFHIMKRTLIISCKMYKEMIQLISYFLLFWNHCTELSQENLILVKINNYNLLSKNNKLLFLNILTNKKEAHLNDLWHYVYSNAVHKKRLSYQLIISQQLLTEQVLQKLLKDVKYTHSKLNHVLILTICSTV